MRRYSLLVTLILILAPFGGCSRTPADPELVKAVEEYCSVIQLVYLQANMVPLAQVATDKESKRVYPVVQALQSTGNAMRTEILSFKAVGSRMGEARAAFVETREKWRFWWEDRRTGQITKPKTEEEYRLTYRLVRDGQRWKVDQVKHEK